MRKFMVNVNGTSYEIQVEELAAGQSFAPAAAPVAAPAPVQAAPIVTAAPKASSAAGEKVCCPMPGTILDVKVKVGDTIKEGQVLMILEAMKMENEIMGPKNGVVAAVNVAKGATVNSGDVLLVIA